jgi:shikimate kinase
MPEVILLCGFSGSGKTETGNILAKNIGYGFTDTDKAVEDILGKPIPENNLEYIKRNGCLVYLKTTPETVHRRLRDSHVRPMLQSFGLSEGKKAAPALERICSLMEKREKYYLQADIVIDTEGRTPDEAAREIKSRLIQDGP